MLNKEICFKCVTDKYPNLVKYRILFDNNWQMKCGLYESPPNYPSEKCPFVLEHIIGQNIDE